MNKQRIKFCTSMVTFSIIGFQQDMLQIIIKCYQLMLIVCNLMRQLI